MAKFQFFGCFDGVVEPSPADSILAGTAPFRGTVHCQPFREANGYGWYSYSPVECFLKWDGSGFYWLPVGQSSWMKMPDSGVTPRILYKLGGRDLSDDLLLSIPVFAPAPEPGILQVWTGLVAVTPPEWSLLVRGVPNMPGNLVHEVLDGIIETGWWHGPLVGNLRFRKTDQVVHLRPAVPLFGIQPIPCVAYQDGVLKEESSFRSAESGDLSGTGKVVSEALRIRIPDNPGGYRREVLKRRRREKKENPAERTESMPASCPALPETHLTPEPGETRKSG
ncbi:DUF6065 family protein [Streptomyces chryseus]